jgi:Na+-driven multidrug efflux pump
LVLSIASTGAVAAGLFFLCGTLARLFVDDVNVINISVVLMRVIAPAYLLYAVIEVLDGAVRGVGCTLQSMVAALVGKCAVSLGWMMVVVPRTEGLAWVIGVFPVSWAAALAVVWYSNSWRRME